MYAMRRNVGIERYRALNLNRMNTDPIMDKLISDGDSDSGSSVV